MCNYISYSISNNTCHYIRATQEATLTDFGTITPDGSTILIYNCTISAHQQRQEHSTLIVVGRKNNVCSKTSIQIKPTAGTNISFAMNTITNTIMNCPSQMSWTQGGTEAQEPAVCTARSRLQLALHARRDPLRDKIREVGRGLSLADTQTGRYGRLYSRRRLCARRGADARLLLQILVSRASDRPNPILLITGSSIPIPVPGQYRLSRCLQ
jgi:hypothetical protein